MIKLIKYIKRLFAIYIIGSSYVERHDYRETKQLIEEYPLYEDPNRLLFGKAYRVSTGYKYKCNIYGMDWHE